MLKVAICDDDKTIQSQVEKNIITVDEQLIVEKYEDEKILKTIKQFDIIFMDIEIGNISGIDLALEVRKQNPNVIIIFITNYTTYISDAFDAIPFQYLLKPLNENKLLEVFKKAVSTIKNRKKYVEISWNGNSKYIECINIIYIEIYNRKTAIHINDGEIEKSSIKFINYANLLKSYGFIRCHNSIIVNMFYIKYIKQNTIILENKEIIPISKKYLKDVKNIFQKKILEEVIC